MRMHHSNAMRHFCVAMRMTDYRGTNKIFVDPFCSSRTVVQFVGGKQRNRRFAKSFMMIDSKNWTFGMLQAQHFVKYGKRAKLLPFSQIQKKNGQCAGLHNFLSFNRLKKKSIYATIRILYVHCCTYIALSLSLTFTWARACVCALCSHPHSLLYWMLFFSLALSMDLSLCIFCVYFIFSLINVAGRQRRHNCMYKYIAWFIESDEIEMKTRAPKKRYEKRQEWC